MWNSRLCGPPQNRQKVSSISSSSSRSSRSSSAWRCESGLTAREERFVVVDRESYAGPQKVSEGQKKERKKGASVDNRKEWDGNNGVRYMQMQGSADKDCGQIPSSLVTIRSQ